MQTSIFLFEKLEYCEQNCRKKDCDANMNTGGFDLHFPQVFQETSRQGSSNDGQQANGRGVG